jgi:hypothetical protein
MNPIESIFLSLNFLSDGWHGWVRDAARIRAKRLPKRNSVYGGGWTFPK